MLNAIDDWDEDALRAALQLYKGEPRKLGEAMQCVLVAYIDICNHNAPHFDKQWLNDAFRMLHILCAEMTLLTNKEMVCAVIKEPDHLGVSVCTLAKEAGRQAECRIQTVLSCAGDPGWPHNWSVLS